MPGPPDDQGDHDQRYDEEGADPTDAFALVGNEVRAEIIRALGDARVEQRYPPVLSFSELRSRAASGCDSSRFNYHLQQLVGHYVERVDEGYRMRSAGRVLYQTIRAGTFDRRESARTVDAGFDCYHCGAAVRTTVDEGTVRVRCPDCEYVYAISGAPPGATEDGEVSLEQVATYYHHKHLAFARGVCPTCGDEPGVELVPVDGLPFADPDRQELYVYRACETCGDQRHLSLGTALLPDPNLRDFCRAHGVDVLATPLWELEFAATDRSVDVRSTDPWEVALTVAYGDDALELVVDGELTVLERHGG